MKIEKYQDRDEFIISDLKIDDLFTLHDISDSVINNLEILDSLSDEKLAKHINSEITDLNEIRKALKNQLKFAADYKIEISKIMKPKTEG